MFSFKSISTLMCAGVMCAALAPGASAQTTTTFLAIGSDPGDPVGNGANIYLAAQTATFTSFQNSGAGRHVWSVTIQPSDNSAAWHVAFTLPSSFGLSLGTRYLAPFPRDLSFSPAISVSNGPGLPCAGQSGSFTLRQSAVDLATLGLVLDLDFEARCDGAAGSLYGQLRLKSTRAGIDVGTVAMSSLSPVAPGTPLRFGVAMDASVPLEFKFIRYRSSTATWEIVQDYGFRPVWAWTPTIGDLDDYYVQVWVRSRGSANAYDEWRPFGPFAISLSSPLVSLGSDVAMPAPAGTSITRTASARGGTNRLEYQFIRYSAAAGLWQIVRDWSTDPQWLQVTTPADEGEIMVVVLGTERQRGWSGNDG